MTVEQRQGRHAERRAAGMRERAMSEAQRRKEEYLGARVPRELREKVIQRAQEMGIPVSILIRNVLEEAFGAEPVSIGALGPKAPMFADVLGWEDITLNRAIECARCSAQLHPGARVTLGLGNASGHIVLCGKCKEFI